jgi:hypothetical protein
MTNQQQGSNEAPKAVTPSQTRPAPQQNQGDGEQDTSKPEQQK